MAKIKYAIVGFGGIAENRIAKEGFALDSSRFTPLRGIELVGATDISGSRKIAAESLGLKWYQSVDDICGDYNINAVFIATNNLSHYPIAKKLIQAKKHVIIEKPIATTIKDAKDLIMLAEKNNVNLAVDHMMIYNAFNIKAAQLVQDGKLGEINDIVLHMEFPYGFSSEEAATWRCANPLEVGGPIGDVASHCFYMAEFLLGEKINSVQAAYTPIINKLKVENGSFIRFKTNKGTSGSIRVSFSDLRGSLKGIFLNLGYEIYGSQKTLRSYGTLFQFSGHSDEPIKLRLEIDDDTGVSKERIRKIQNIYQAIIENHANSIKKDLRITGEEALHNLDLILLSHESAKNNGKIMHLKKNKEKK